MIELYCIVKAVLQRVYPATLALFVLHKNP